MLTEAFFIVSIASTSAVEPLWFWLCRNYSEFAIIVVGCFITQIVGYFLGCLPYVLIDVGVLKPTSAEKIQNTYPDRRTQAKAAFDMLACFVLVVLPMLFLGGVVMPYVGISSAGRLPPWYQILIHIAYFFLVEDYFNYWVHRWLHLPWLYRHIHSVHHTYDAPFALVAAYAHPVEVFLQGIPTFLGPLLVAPHLYTVLLWQIFRNFEAIDIHSGYEFPYSIKSLIPAYAGTRHHDYHHYMHSGNFASVFTWCDQLYGTSLGYEAHMARRDSQKER